MTSMKIKSVEIPERWRLQGLVFFYRLSRLSNFIVTSIESFSTFGVCKLKALKQGLASLPAMTSLFGQPLLRSGRDFCFVFPTSRV